MKRKRQGVCSITEQIDTSIAYGRLIFQITNAMAEFERGLISERTRAEMKAAKAQGQKLGRPAKLTKVQVNYAWARRENGETMKTIADSFNIKRSTLYSYFKKYKKQLV